MQRLVRKFETAQDMVPRPLQANAAKPTKYGVIYFGSTSPAMDEAIVSWRNVAISSTGSGFAPSRSIPASRVLLPTMISYMSSSRTAMRSCAH